MDVVASGPAALDRLTTRPYDAVITDLVMEPIDGVRFLELLTRVSPEHASRLAFLTGGAFSPAMVEFLESVPCPKLEKQFDSADLHALLDRLVSPRT